jgi:cytoskeletal protein RodZ
MTKYEEIGKILKDKRENKKLTIEEISDKIKIRKQYISSLEDGDISQIPGEAYITGYIKIYSSCLGVDDKISEILLRNEDAPSKNRIKFKEINNSLNKKPYILLILGLIFLALLILLVLPKNNNDAKKSTHEYILEDDL